MIECLAQSDDPAINYVPTLGVATFAPRHSCRNPPGTRGLLLTPQLCERFIEHDLDTGERSLEEGFPDLG